MAEEVKSRGLEIADLESQNHSEVLTPGAIDFIQNLQRHFNPRRKSLLEARRERQIRIDAGERPTFLESTQKIRSDRWTVAPLPPDILDRRVEITGPVERKMVINALNSGAKVFMADFEDSTTPTWRNLLDGHINLRDAIRRTITYTDPGTGKDYKLNDRSAVLFVRPRGWHMEERHLLIDGEPMSASLFDFGLYFYHNAKELIARGTGPYFYLPKIESHLEARLWNDVFVMAQNELNIPLRTIKATVLIETILASFEMDEILYELRDHSAGLNCGRWDYIFSFIKKFSEDPNAVLPDRARVTMTTHFMKSYSLLVIKTCHQRNVHAIGGMSAYIPVKSDPDANQKALDQVRADKEREANDGHDGTWVAHPGLVPLATAVFDERIRGQNQIDVTLPEHNPSAEDLLTVPRAEITEHGVRQNVVIAMNYLQSWLRGIGCVPLFNLMEDAATAEISRAQLWQWVHHHARLSDGRLIDLELVEAMIQEELKRFRMVEDASRLAPMEDAARIVRELVQGKQFTEFLTAPAYERLLRNEEPASRK